MSDLGAIKARFGLGQAVRRPEDARLLTGHGRFTHDVMLPGQAHAVMLRSPHAHARIRAIDPSAALALPGVLLVLTAADLEADGVGSIPCLAPVTNSDGTAMVEPPTPVLVNDTVRHVGDNVALVVAETREAARDGAEAVVVDYEPLPAAVELAAAAQPDAPVVWPEVGSNIAFDWERGDRAAVEARFARAAHVVAIEVVNNRIAMAPIETRGAVARWDPREGTFELHVTSQGVHDDRTVMGRDIFRIAPSRITVRSRDVGGSFGLKHGLISEQIATMAASRRLGRAVSWVPDRSESFVSDFHGRDHVTRTEIALDGEGRILALRSDDLAGMGAYLSIYNPMIPTIAASPVITGVYAIPAIHVRVRGVYTNTVPVAAYRGAGRPEANYALERLLDKAAAELGFDPIELRRRNAIAREAFPYLTGTGSTYDSGDHARHIEKALAMADRAGFAARRAASAAAGKLRGFGLACYVERCGSGPSDMTEVRVDALGGVTVLAGGGPSGQGQEATLAHLVGRSLGVAPGDVRVVQGDTTAVAYGQTTAGARFAVINGGATVIAVERLIEKGRRIAAAMLEAAEADVEFEAGRFSIVGTDRGVGLAEVAAASFNRAYLGPDLDPGLSACGYFAAGGTFPNGSHVCELEVDPETGRITLERYVAVDDFGVLINPMIVEGQVHGGVAQGIGQALHERIVHDAEGQLLTGSFMDYGMIRADDLPSFEVDWIEVPTPTNPLGAKGCGEAGALGAPPAVMNALLDALADTGVRHLDMPATPETVWRAIRDAKGA